MQLIEQQNYEPQNYFSTRWDLYSEKTESKAGWVTDLHTQGCTLRTNEPIALQRWVRLIVDCDGTGIALVAVGRIIQSDSALEANFSPEITTYRMTVEFAYDLDLILALSRRNLRVFSCRTRKAKSSSARGFLA